MSTHQALLRLWIPTLWLIAMYSSHPPLQFTSTALVTSWPLSRGPRTLNLECGSPNLVPPRVTSLASSHHPTGGSLRDRSSSPSPPLRTVPRLISRCLPPNSKSSEPSSRRFRREWRDMYNGSPGRRVTRRTQYLPDIWVRWEK